MQIVGEEDRRILHSVDAKLGKLHQYNGMSGRSQGRQLTDNEVRKVDEDVRRWLSPPDPSVNHNRALMARHEGTGKWLLLREDFREWKATDCGVYWLYALGAHCPYILATPL